MLLSDAELPVWLSCSRTSRSSNCSLTRRSMNLSSSVLKEQTGHNWTWCLPVVYVRQHHRRWFRNALSLVLLLQVSTVSVRAVLIGETPVHEILPKTIMPHANRGSGFEHDDVQPAFGEYFSGHASGCA